MLRTRKSQVFFSAAVALLVLCLAAVTPASASGREKVLYDFYGPQEQVTNPEGVLTVDAAGNLYGVSNGVAPYPNGVIFEMTPGPNGKWTEKVIYVFTGGSDGQGPNSGFVFDAAGNLYGAANQGGDLYGGTIFELSPNPNGMWTETTLYAFGTNSSDGIIPGSGLIADAAGNLYGGTMFGGNFQDNHCSYGGGQNIGCGAIFKLTHNPDGSWTESTLYSLLYIDGYEIFSNLAFDAAGNLYGMATWGGTETCLGRGNSNCGTVFQLALQPDGSWMYHRLYSFQGGTDGSDPVREGSLLFDSQGNLYGTTTTGGNTGCSNRYYIGCGTVFKLTPQPNGTWTETVLHVFGSAAGEGTSPYAVTFDAAGNLQGVAAGGGAYGFGSYFKLKPGLKGQWTSKTLYSFGGYYGDSQNPMGALTSGADGNLYGIGFLNGNFAHGAFYRIKP